MNGLPNPRCAAVCVVVLVLSWCTSRAQEGDAYEAFNRFCAEKGGKTAARQVTMDRSRQVGIRP